MSDKQHVFFLTLYLIVGVSSLTIFIQIGPPARRDQWAGQPNRSASLAEHAGDHSGRHLQAHKVDYFKTGPESSAHP